MPRGYDPPVKDPKPQAKSDRVAWRWLKTPWPLTLLLLVPVWLIVQSRVWSGVRLGVVDRGILELWVHGAQPGWLDWVPFIHPPGYSLFMNSADAVARGAGISPDALIFFGGGALTLMGSLLAVAVAHRRWGSNPALLVAALTVLDPQTLRPFEHYPLARLALLLAFVMCTERPRVAVGVAVATALLAVEIHLSSWFLLGPLLAWGVLMGRGGEPARSRRVLAWLLGLFAVSALLGLWEVLSFGGGPKGDPGSATWEWANPLLLAALIPALAVPSQRAAVASLGCFAGITWGLQIAQMADGSPFPFSLHYFELIGPILVLVVVGAGARWAGGRGVSERRMVLLVAALLVLSQWALFGRGFVELFVQPRWILMAG